MTEETIKILFKLKRGEITATDANNLINEQHDAEMVDRLLKVGLELRDKRHEVIQTLRSSVVSWNDIVEIFDRHGIDLVDKVEF